jgi:hypothetical protein
MVLIVIKKFQVAGEGKQEVARQARSATSPNQA